MERAVEPRSSSATVEVLPSEGRVHVIGAGPVGLLLAALLQSGPGRPVCLYEKRPQYTRSRMVKLAPYLAADSLESYRADSVDGDNVEAVFDPPELEEGLAFRQSIPSDVMALLRDWTRGFVPLNTIENSLRSLIEARPSHSVEAVASGVTADAAMAMLAPGDILIDCTGCKSLLRDGLAPGPDGAFGAGANTVTIRLEFAAVITFLYGQPYDCNEYCKYYKNRENHQYKFIPAVGRTCYDGSVSHVTGIVNIAAEDYEAMPPQFDGQWLRSHFPEVARSMDRFIEKIRQETRGEIIGDLSIVRIPMNLYRARNATSRRWRAPDLRDHPFARSPVFLVGDSAIGSPYFQSISLGFECAMFLAGLLAQPGLPLRDLFDRYELYMYKQWIRVYMRSKMIKHNKDLFETIDDPMALLAQLHIY